MPHTCSRDHGRSAREDGFLSVVREQNTRRHAPCVLSSRTRRRSCRRALPARWMYARGTIPANYAVPPWVVRAIPRLEDEQVFSTHCRSECAVRLRDLDGVDSPRGHAQRCSGVQPVWKLWRCARVERDAVRGVCTEAKQTSSSLLSVFPRRVVHGFERSDARGFST